MCAYTGLQKLKNKKILLFSRDPGGANTIISLVKPLEERGCQICLYGKDAALAKYAHANLNYANIMDVIEDVTLSSVERLITNEKPDLIITGTSADDYTEKFIWNVSEKLKIPSFAIMDQWVNYGVRFSNYGVSELREYAKNRLHPYQPSKILVMDEIAKNEAVKEGLEPTRIEITGNPYIETLFFKATEITKDKINDIKKRFGVKSGDFFITFVSEPISDTYQETDLSGHYWGYSERIIFRYLLSSLSEAVNSGQNRIIIVLRLHPKERKNNFYDIINDFNHSNILIYIDKDSDPLELVLASNLVCGMSSMLLIESMVLSIPIMSIQIGLIRESPFLPDRLGIAKSILTEADLKRNLKMAISGNFHPSYQFDIIRNPVENIIKLVEMHICIN
jgi:hypothetical protein